MALWQDSWTYVILTQKDYFYIALNLAEIEKKKKQTQINIHLQ